MSRLIPRACLSAVVMAGVSGLLGAHAQRAEPNVRFRWAFAALRKGAVTLTPVRNGLTLQTGDRLKMYLNPATPVFAYVIAQSPDGALELLFPAALDNPQTPAGTESFIPPRDEWLQLDEHTGKEAFYLVVSATRLTSLERTLRAYTSARPADRAAAAKAVTEEMQALRTRFFDEQATAEAPVDIGGTRRGIADLAAMAADVSARNFYSRTIAFDHR